MVVFITLARLKEVSRHGGWRESRHPKKAGAATSVFAVLWCKVLKATFCDSWRPAETAEIGVTSKMTFALWSRLVSTNSRLVPF